ncbi:hypothetical protein [Helicobacter saguini]|nr:hypothetical protein [Helicobacter saguini]
MEMLIKKLDSKTKDSIGSKQTESKILRIISKNANSLSLSLLF